MAVDFKNSETKDNLMRAFAGESQARNRYVFAAGQAKAQKVQVLERIFRYTADQEQEHAKVFYDFLKEMAGETIHIDGGYPVDIDQSLARLLRMAEHNELEEYEVVYKAFGDKAKEEGFAEIARHFSQIAEIEKVHAQRFERFAKYLQDNKLFVSDVETGWMCLNCGHVLSGKQAPAKCPVCSHDQGYFIRLELSPYAK